MKEIAKEILIWHKNIDRDLPWKQTENPYFIWLSEIILQQTRVEQGRNYYLKFISTFPTIHDLANASEDEVLNLWQGLGYYSRARNLHASAKYVSTELNGQFPTTYKEILKLKGVGPYTAAAIASFAFNESVAVLDGNVFRVLSRLFDVDTDILSTRGKNDFTKLANELLGDNNASLFNQAIMDFGALQCTPKPKCDICPLHRDCLSIDNNTVNQRPVKKKKKARKKRFFHYFVSTNNHSILLEKRLDNDIWKGLYQFPLLELDENNVIVSKDVETINLRPKTKEPIFQSKQILSHQEIFAFFYENTLNNTSIQNSYQWIKLEDLHTIGFPKTIVDFLKYKNLLKAQHQ